MTTSARVRVYMACSLDGFIAGPDDDLSWLEPASDAPEEPPPPSGALEFADFMQQVGVLLMGRRTYDVTTALLKDAPSPYGDTPVLVVTHRPLDAWSESVRAVSGDIAQVVAEAKRVVQDKDVYLDGGDLIRQALNAGLVDELVITFIPILLTAGVRLFDGLLQRQDVEFVSHHRYGHDKLQVTVRVKHST